MSLDLISGPNLLKKKAKTILDIFNPINFIKIKNK